jgi:hypothetical protein
MSTPNNPILQNAALGGISAAAGAGVNPSGAGSVVTAVNAEVVAQALTIAEAIDAAIPTDSTISGGGGTTLAGSTGAIVNAQTSKAAALGLIAQAAFEGQGNLAALPGGAQAAIVAGIVAKYTATIGSLVTG